MGLGKTVQVITFLLTIRLGPSMAPDLRLGNSLNSACVQRRKRDSLAGVP